MWNKWKQLLKIFDTLVGQEDYLENVPLAFGLQQITIFSLDMASSTRPFRKAHTGELKFAIKLILMGV